MTNCEDCIETHNAIEQAPNCAGCPTPAESRAERWRGTAVELEKENARLRARLAAVRTICEANNWMGTAMMCGEG